MKRVTTTYLKEAGSSEELIRYFIDEYSENGRPSTEVFLSRLPTGLPFVQDLCKEAYKVTKASGLLRLREPNLITEIRYSEGVKISACVFNTNGKIMGTIDYKEAQILKKSIEVLKILFPEGISVAEYGKFIRRYEDVKKLSSPDLEIETYPDPLHQKEHMRCLSITEQIKDIQAGLPEQDPDLYIDPNKDPDPAGEDKENDQGTDPNHTDRTE